MNRRSFVRLAAAGAGATASLPAVASGSTGAVERSATVDPADGVRHADWTPHYAVDVERDGHATVTLTLEGSEVPGRVFVGHRDAAGLEILGGESSLREHSAEYEWHTSGTRELQYALQLGHLQTGSSQMRVFEDALLGMTNELLPIWDWDDGGDRQASTWASSLPSATRYTVDPPDGWAAVCGGTEVEANTWEAVPKDVSPAPRELFVVGDVDVHARSVGDATLSVVSLPEADGEAPGDVLDQLAAAMPWFGGYYGTVREHSTLGLIVPDSVEPNVGGQNFDNSFLVNEHAALVGTHDTFMTELAGCYHRVRFPFWIRNGIRPYLERLVLHEIGLLTRQEVRDHVVGRGSDGGEPYEVALVEPHVSVDDDTGAADYKAGAVCAALDLDVGARTDGEATIADWLDRVNVRRRVPEGSSLSPAELEAAFHSPSRRELVGALLDATGLDYTDFFERYVDGEDYPTELLDDWSFSDPPTVAFVPFRYDDVAVDPETVAPDEQVTVSVELTNVGDEASSLDVAVHTGPSFPHGTFYEAVADEATATSVDLDAGESTTLTTEFAPSTTGDRSIYVNGWEAASVTVEAADDAAGGETGETSDGTDDGESEDAGADDADETEAGSDGANDGTPGFGLLGALSALTGAAHVLRRRSGDDR